MSQEDSNTVPQQNRREQQGVVRILRFLLWSILVIVLAVALALAAYMGVPAIYRDYIEPVRQNSQRIDAMESALEEIQLTGGFEAREIEDRLVELEGRVASMNEVLAEIQSDMSRANELSAGRAEEVRTLEGRVGELEGALERVSSALVNLEETVSVSGTPQQRLVRQIQILRAMELLTRARMRLIENNIGMAHEAIVSARAGLAEVLRDMPAEERELLDEAVGRLDLVLLNLHLSPVVASEDLEIAWRLLQQATAPEAQLPE